MGHENLKKEGGCMQRWRRWWLYWKTCCSNIDLSLPGALAPSSSGAEVPEYTVYLFLGPQFCIQKCCSCVVWHVYGANTCNCSRLSELYGWLTFYPDISVDLVLPVPPAVSHSISASYMLCAVVWMSKNALVLLIWTNLYCSAVLQQAKRVC